MSITPGFVSHSRAIRWSETVGSNSLYCCGPGGEIDSLTARIVGLISPRAILTVNSTASRPRSAVSTCG